MAPVLARTRRLYSRFRAVAMCLFVVASCVLPCLRRYRDAQQVPVFPARETQSIELPRTIHTLSCCTKNAREGLLPPPQFHVANEPKLELEKVRRGGGRTIREYQLRETCGGVPDSQAYFFQIGSFAILYSLQRRWRMDGR